jgi:hypothetical protein
MIRKIITVAVLLIIIMTPVIRTQEMPVPVKLQYQLFLKVLTFDRNLKKRVGDEIVFGIAFQSKFRTSLIVMESMVRVIDKSQINEVEDIPIRCVTIDLSNEDNLEEVITKKKVNILYVTPLRAFDIDIVKAISQAKKITTLTGIPEYVEAGIGVGIGTKGQRPQIMINLSSSKAEGSDFSSRLLNLARIIE